MKNKAKKIKFPIAFRNEANADLVICKLNKDLVLYNMMQQYKNKTK